jgi:hypothetical protein
MGLEVRTGRLVSVRADGDVDAEATLLRAIAGAGAPEVVAGTPGPIGELVTTVLPPLRLGDLSLAETAESLAVVADVLARAHAVGIVHGPIRAEHLQGAPGNVLLGGWSTDAGGDVQQDVASLGQWIEQAAERHPELHAIARRARAADAPTATAIAASLRATGHGSERSGRQNHAQFGLLGVGLVATVVLIALAVVAPRGGATVDAHTPPTTERSPAVVEHGGQQVRVGSPGDVVLHGRFTCQEEVPAVFRPSTGQLWVFASWGAGAGELVATRPGATEAGYRRDGSCDRLELRDAQGRWRAVG